MLVVVFFLVAVILAGLATFGVAAGRVSLLAASVAFGWLALLTPHLAAAV